MEKLETPITTTEEFGMSDLVKIQQTIKSMHLAQKDFMGHV